MRIRGNPQGQGSHSPPKTGAGQGSVFSVFEDDTSAVVRINNNNKVTVPALMQQQRSVLEGVRNKPYLSVDYVACLRAFCAGRGEYTGGGEASAYPRRTNGNSPPWARTAETGRGAPGPQARRTSIRGPRQSQGAIRRIKAPMGSLIWAVIC